MFCHVPPAQVLGVHDLSSVYHVPLLLRDQGIVTFLRKRLNLDSIPNSLLSQQTPSPSPSPAPGQSSSSHANGTRATWAERQKVGLELERRWIEMTGTQERLYEGVGIALVGKYTDLKDSYMSVIKSLEHAAFKVKRKLSILVSSLFYFKFVMCLLKGVCL